MDEAEQEARERVRKKEEEGKIEGNKSQASSSSNEEVLQDSAYKAFAQNYVAVTIIAKELEQSVDEEIDRHQSKKPNSFDDDWESGLVPY